MSTTSSEPGSVPTNLACVTASAIFSMAIAALSPRGSVQSINLSIKTTGAHNVLENKLLSSYKLFYVHT